MRRLLIEPTRYLTDLGRSALRAWAGFFFTPADPTPLGLIRVMVGALLFWDVAVLGLDLRDYLGSDGWIGLEAVRQYLAETSPWAWSFWLWVPDEWLVVAWAACLVILACFTIGLGSRLTAVLAWAVAVSTVRRAPVAQFGFDHMISTWALYLAAFGASGQALSLDRFLARYRALRRGSSGPGRGDSGAGTGTTGVPAATVAANLSLRLIQLHLALIYGSSGLAKLMGPEWWDGTALEMIVLTPEFRRADFAWLLAYPALLGLLTHAGVLLEIGYPVLIWTRKLRPLLIVAVASMHFGIDLILGLTEFGLAMVAANLAFVSGPWLRGLVTGPSQPAGHLLLVRETPRLRALATLIVAADPDQIVPAGAPEGVAMPEPTPRGNRPALLLVRPDHVPATDSDALLIVSRWLPVLWPLGLVGSLPGVRPVLRRLFDRAFADEPGNRPLAGPRTDRRARSTSERPPDPAVLAPARCLDGRQGGDEPGRSARLPALGSLPVVCYDSSHVGTATNRSARGGGHGGAGDRGADPSG